MVQKPALARYKYNIDGDRETTKLIATSSHEIVSIVVTATGSSIAVRVYDTDSSSRLDVSQSILLAANQGESSTYCPAQPVPMTKGIYVVIENGAGFGGEAFLTYN